MKIIKWLDKNLEVALMIISLLVIVFVMGAQVVARKCLGMSIEWSEELGRYLFVWMGFLSISYTIHAKSIIRLEIFNAILRPAILKVIDIAVQIFMLVIFVYLTYQSLSILSTTAQRWSSINLSMNYVYAAIPVGFALTSLRLVENILQALLACVKKTTENPGEIRLGINDTTSSITPMGTLRISMTTIAPKIIPNILFTVLFRCFFHTR